MLLGFDPKFPPEFKIRFYQKFFTYLIKNTLSFYFNYFANIKTILSKIPAFSTMKNSIIFKLKYAPAHEKIKLFPAFYVLFLLSKSSIVEIRFSFGIWPTTESSTFPSSSRKYVVGIASIPQ